jgi:hypothetical protein
MNINDKLFINKKAAAKPDTFLNELELTRHSSKWNRLFYGNPDLFHVRYFWKDEINFEVLNPEVSSDWFICPETPKLDEQAFVDSTSSYGLRSLGLAAVRKWQRLRKKKSAELSELLVCPECHGSLDIGDDAGSCSNCHVSYPLHPVPDFNRPVSFESETGSLRVSHNADFSLHSAV